jgi:hypothetical protein
LILLLLEFINVKCSQLSLAAHKTIGKNAISRKTAAKSSNLGPCLKPAHSVIGWLLADTGVEIKHTLPTFFA